MADLITPENKALYSAALKDVWDTFKRPFVLMIEAELATIVPEDPNWSPFGQQDQNSLPPPQLVPKQYAVYATIKYSNGQEYDFSTLGDQQLKLRNSEGRVRLKLDAEGYALMKQCKQVSLDDMLFEIDTTPRPHGLFSPDRWTYHLQVLQPPTS